MVTICVMPGSAETFDGLAGEQAVGAHDRGLARAGDPQDAEQLDDRTRGGDLVVQHDDVPALHVADDAVDHHRVVGEAALGPGGDREAQVPGELGGHLGVAEVRGDHDGVREVEATEVRGQLEGRAQVVHGDREEPVHLGRVQRHRQHPGRARRLQHVGDQARADGDPRGVLLVGAGVREVRDHRGDRGRRGASRGVEHRAAARTGGPAPAERACCTHVHVPAAAVRPQLHLQAVVAEPRRPRRRQLDAEDVAHLPRERRMGGA